MTFPVLTALILLPLVGAIATAIINEKRAESVRIVGMVSAVATLGLAVWMLAAFRQLGCDARIDQAGNVVAFLQPNAPPPYVAITAHLDTVLAPRGPEEVRTEADGAFVGPRRGQLRDDIVRGPGGVKEERLRDEAPETRTQHCEGFGEFRRQRICRRHEIGRAHV